jgi:hypothetical protein
MQQCGGGQAVEQSVGGGAVGHLAGGPPFCARCRGIDQHLRRRSAGRRQGVDDVDPDAFGRSAHEAVVQRLARSVDRRRVDPAPARFQHMHDAADDTQVVNPRLAARVRGQQWRQPRSWPTLQRAAT